MKLANDSEGETAGCGQVASANSILANGDNNISININSTKRQLEQRTKTNPKLPVLNSVSFDNESSHQFAIRDLKKNQEDDQIQQHPQQARTIGPTRKRYFILIMFVTLHMIKSFQWICLASVTNVVARFYRVDHMAINWTTILFMVTFLVFAMPISWIMEKIGLRRAVLYGALGVTCGVIIKCFSCHHEGFLYCMLGHLIVGLAEPFFFSSYSQVASVWFPDNQVAMATAWSVIGEQMGLALGFIIPPLMIGSDPNDDASIQSGLFRLFLAVAVISTLNTISIVIFFDEKPKLAPGIARFKQIQQEEIRRRSSQAVISEQLQRRLNLTAAALAAAKKSTGVESGKPSVLAQPGRGDSPGAISMRAREVRQSVSQQLELSREIMLNKNFILLLIGFGLNVGTVCSIHTLLNQMITQTTVTTALPVESILDQMGTLNETTLTTTTSSSSSNITMLVGDHHPKSSSKLVDLDIDLLVAEGAGSSMMIPRWDGDDANLVVGNTGLISILAGLLGSALCGFVLDKFHRYKLTTSLIYLITLISMISLTVCLRLGSSMALYLVALPLGFAFTGYASCGFDYGVEITYPNPELLSSTLLNISAQICGIPISLVGSIIVDTYGSEALGLFFCAILLAGFLITCLQGGQLKRQDAVREGKTQTSCVMDAA